MVTNKKGKPLKIKINKKLNKELLDKQLIKDNYYVKVRNKGLFKTMLNSLMGGNLLTSSALGITRYITCNNNNIYIFKRSGWIRKKEIKMKTLKIIPFNEIKDIKFRRTYFPLINHIFIIKHKDGKIKATVISKKKKLVIKHIVNLVEDYYKN